MNSSRHWLAVGMMYLGTPRNDGTNSQAATNSSATAMVMNSGAVVEGRDIDGGSVGRAGTGSSDRYVLNSRTRSCTYRR